MPTGLVPLNLYDRAVLGAERVVMSRGVSGFATGLVFLFRGRIVLSQLQDSANRLAARWPLLTARLTRKPYMAWAPTGCQTLPVREMALDCDSDETLAQAVTQLKTEPLELEKQDPMHLVLLHRPGGNDALFVRISHVLFDAHAAINLLRQLLDPSQVPPNTGEEDVDPYAVAMANHPFRKRMKAMLAMMKKFRQSPPLNFPQPEKWPKRLQVGPTTLRWLDEEKTAALESRLESISPFASPTLAATASGFRAMKKFLGRTADPNGVYEVVFAYDLRRGRHKKISFHNVVQRLFLSARPDQLQDREQLIRLLIAQFRYQISHPDNELFLGQIQLAQFICLLTERLSWVIPLLKPFRSRSLRVSYVPQLFGYGTPYLGSVLEGFFVSTLCCAPMGASLDMVKIGKRMLLVFMHSPEVLTDEQAARFFTDWADDLCQPQEAAG